MYDLIESRSKGPYLELFARNLREGWDSIGNQLQAAENSEFDEIYNEILR
jgi:N6-adenosine-specific RNA methylase IME4